MPVLFLDDLGQEHSAEFVNATISDIVSRRYQCGLSRPTVVATNRCPCSQKRLPTILGKNWPFESGQSDVANPASWLVTSAPAMIKKNVAPASSSANR